MNNGTTKAECFEEMMSIGQRDTMVDRNSEDVISRRLRQRRMVIKRNSKIRSG